MVVAGAKSYTYQTAYGCTDKGKVLVKQKGITLDRANDKVDNFHNMKTMVLNTKIVYELDSEGQQEWVDEMKDRC